MLKHQLFRSPYQSLAALMVVSLSLFLISVSLFAGLGLKTILSYFESKPQVSAFLRDEIKVLEIDLLKTKITGLGGIKSIDYLSKENALEIYKQQFKDEPQLLEMVTAKTLPASLEITTDDLADLQKVAELLRQEPMVEDVIFQEDIVAALSSWVRTIRSMALVFGVYLSLMSILVILVTVGMKISQKRDELDIIKLLGASSWYLKKPFIVEGVLYGVIAAVLSWLIANAAILIETPYLSTFLNGIISFPLPLLTTLPILGILLLLGLTIGLIGSWFAVSRFGRSIR